MDKNIALVLERPILGRNFKLYGTIEEPLFLAKDVAEWIEHSKVSKMISTIDAGEKLKETMFTSGQRREVWFLTEEGVYEVLMQSRKPIAKAFKKEVKKILKEIRATGMYVKDDVLEYMVGNPDMAIEILKKVKSHKVNVETLKLKLIEQKPKVVFARAVEASDTTILVGGLAKLIKQNGVDIGQNRLFRWMRENGYLIKKSGNNHNLPTQRSMDMELFRIKEVAIEKGNGEVEITKTPLVTGKGQIYFINKFISLSE